MNNQILEVYFDEMLQKFTNYLDNEKSIKIQQVNEDFKKLKDLENDTCIRKYLDYKKDKTIEKIEEEYISNILDLKLHIRDVLNSR